MSKFIDEKINQIKINLYNQGKSHGDSGTCCLTAFGCFLGLNDFSYIRDVFESFGRERNKGCNGYILSRCLGYLKKYHRIKRGERFDSVIDFLRKKNKGSFFLSCKVDGVYHMLFCKDGKTTMDAFCEKWEISNFYIELM